MQKKGCSGMREKNDRTKTVGRKRGEESKKGGGCGYRRQWETERGEEISVQGNVLMMTDI